jgi:thymidylate synthase
MNKGEQQYLDLLRKIINEGDERLDRTGVGTRALFGESMKFDLADGFPLLTTKRIFFRGVFEELEFFIRGQSSNKILKDKGIHIWDEWEREDGDLGRVYGVQWRDWQSITRNMKDVNSIQIGHTFTKKGHRTDLFEDHIDQLADLIKCIKENPFSRYQVVLAWNPAEKHLQALPPCHMFFQTFVAKGRLSLQMYQRSCDTLLGVPFNIASYALLTHLLAQQTGLEPGVFTWIGGDVHVYNNHISQVNEQLTRVPKPFPRLILPNISPDNIEDYEFDMIRLEGYEPYAGISAPIAI